ncbi:hypothetical protein M0R45_000683 [Rubus argutus]|uniref:C2H2-type domain-containing protein n=1 Tax=Rubus argutus TaxID=59490 RepID=A0AAW1VKQ3_RUBAR
MLQVYGNQRGPYGSMGPVNYQGPSNPWYMPQAVTHRNQVPLGPFQPRFLPPRPNFLPSAQTLAPPYSVVPANSVPHGLPPQGVSPVNNSGPVISSNLSAYSGLLNSLMAQGVISLKKQSTVLQEKDCVGCEFTGLNLNSRHESVLRIGLYEGGLPSQCKNCGLRFKCQEEHSSHMDWHRFLVDFHLLWLAAVAEKKRKSFDEEMVVPADEDQRISTGHGSITVRSYCPCKCSSEGSERKRLRMS